LPYTTLYHKYNSKELIVDNYSVLYANLHSDQKTYKLYKAGWRSSISQGSIVWAPFGEIRGSALVKFGEILSQKKDNSELNLVK